MPLAQTGFQAAGQFESSLSSSLEGGASLGAGAATAGISAGVGLVLGLGMSLLAAHDQRYKDAQNENAAVTQAVVVFDNDIRSIFAAANAGAISAAEAIQYLEQTRQAYWQYVGQFQGQPGVAARPCSSFNPPTACAGLTIPPCDKTCTAGCCVGCRAIEPAIANAIFVLQAGGGVVHVCKVFPSVAKYGNPGREGYTIEYVQPDIIAGTSGAVNGFLNLLGLGTPAGTVSPLAANLKPLGASVQGSKLATYAILGLAGFFILRSVTR